MAGIEAHDPLVALLRAHHAALVSAIVLRARAEAPGYTALVSSVLAARISATLETITRSLEERDPAVLAHYLEDLIRSRLDEGLAIESLLQVWQFIEGALHELVIRELAADPTAQTLALRRVDTIGGTGRHVVGRVNLATVIHKMGELAPAAYTEG